MSDTLLKAPFIYALCMEEHGKDFINSVVGQETSGGQYNKISLDSKRRPHNPMINTGQVFTDSWPTFLLWIVYMHVTCSMSDEA